MSDINNIVLTWEDDIFPIMLKMKEEWVKELNARAQIAEPPTKKELALYKAKNTNNTYKYEYLYETIINVLKNNNELKELVEKYKLGEDWVSKRFWSDYIDFYRKNT